MRFVETNGIKIHYRIDGPADGPVIVLSNSIGTDLSLWDGVVDGLASHFRVLRYDSRGHGRSDVPDGPYTIAMLGADVLGMLDQLGLGKVHFCGLSLGGMVGMWLATNHPGRIASLVLCNTAAWVPPPEGWDARANAVRADGMDAIRPAVLERWLSEPFRTNQTAALARLLAMVQASPPGGYIGSCAAIRDMDQRQTIQGITAPTLVVAGSKDIATSPEALRYIAANVAGDAGYVELDCGHMSPVELPAALSAEIRRFLTTE
jgi:3-oxoadipate enol-lactonase